MRPGVYGGQVARGWHGVPVSYLPGGMPYTTVNGVATDIRSDSPSPQVNDLRKQPIAPASELNAIEAL